MSKNLNRASERGRQYPGAIQIRALDVIRSAIQTPSLAIACNHEEEIVLSILNVTAKKTRRAILTSS